MLFTTGRKRYTFNDCHLMPLAISVQEMSVFRFIQGKVCSRITKRSYFENCIVSIPFQLVAQPNQDGSCASIQVQGQVQGHTNVVVTYNYLDVTLETRVTIAVYKPLRVQSQILIFTSLASFSYWVTYLRSHCSLISAHRSWAICPRYTCCFERDCLLWRSATLGSWQK